VLKLWKSQWQTAIRWAWPYSLLSHDGAAHLSWCLAATNYGDSGSSLQTRPLFHPSSGQEAAPLPQVRAAPVTILLLLTFSILNVYYHSIIQLYWKILRHTTVIAAFAVWRNIEAVLILSQCI